MNNMPRNAQWTLGLGSLVLLCLALAVTSSPATAQSVNKWSGGVGGTWVEGGSGWTSGTWNSATSTIARFTSATPLNITISGGVTVYGLDFQFNSYSLSGGIITFADPSSVGGTAGIISVTSGISPTINSVIAGNVGLTLTGGGTLFLAGVNTYTGLTSVSQGTLIVNGSTAAGSAFTVASGATLGGGGTVAGTVAANGIIAPGAGLTAGNYATLRTGAIAFSSTGSLVENVGAIGNDSLVVNGTANLAGTLTVNATNPDQSLYVLLSATSITGAFITSTIPTGYGLQVTPTQISLGKLVITAPSLTASDAVTNDNFGYSVSQSGTIALVGAFAKNSAQGVGYVFRGLDTATGTVNQNVKLTASDAANNDNFGYSVSQSGTIGLVGAYNKNSAQGAAYLFRGLDTATGTVTQNVNLTASDGAAGDSFGLSVSQSGTIGLVGSYGNNNYQGAAYLFRGLDTATGTVTQNVKLTASDGVNNEYFGKSVSLSGTIGLVGAVGKNSNQGAAYLYRGLDTATGTVTQNVKLTASDAANGDLFGVSVSLSGTTGLVGAYGKNSFQGVAYLFRGLDTATGAVTQNVKLTASDAVNNDLFGFSVSLSGDQYTIAALGKNSNLGKAYTGTVSSVTTLDLGGASRTIDSLSFVSQDDWIVGQNTSANQVTLNAGNTVNVTASGKAVYVGQNSGSNNNKLVIACTLTATQITIGTAGNTGNVLQLGNGGTTGTLSTGSVITNNGTLVFNRSNTITQGTDFGSAAITGTGGVTQVGTGTTILNAANSYTGTTTINAGVLRLDGATSLPGGIDTTVGINESGLTLNGGVLGLGTGDFTRTLGTGAGQVQFTGSGGFAAYNADRLVNFGGASATVTWASGSFVPNASTLILSAADATNMVTLLNPIDFNGATRTVQVDNGGAAVDATLSGTLSNGSLIKTGAGTLALTGTNSYTGGTTVIAGTLNVFNDVNLGSSANAITLSGGTLQTSSTYSAHALTVSGASTIDVASGFTTLQNAAFTGSGTLTKTGGGTFFLGSSSGNTFSGNITLAVNGGTFKIGSSVSSGTASGSTLSGLTSASTITVNGGATFYIEDFFDIGSSAGYVANRFGSSGSRPAVSMNGGTFRLNGANTNAVMTHTLGALILASGSSTISVNWSGGTPELIFSSLSRNSGAFVRFESNNFGTAATGVPHILFTSAPALIGGGGAANNSTISILPGAWSTNFPVGNLFTYGANGIRPLVTAEYYVATATNINGPGANINGAGATENVMITTGSFKPYAALSGPKTINALVVDANNGSVTWAMGNTLTLTSGQFILRSISSLDISSGALTAGTFNGSPIDLDISILQTMTLGANVINNGSTVVTFVKNGGSQLTFNNSTDNTYSGGTFVNAGILSTMGITNRHSLGTGAVTVDGGGTLVLNAPGATSFSGSIGSPTFTVRTGGEIIISNVVPNSNEFFKIEAGAVIAVTGSTGAGGLDLNTNLNAAPGAILAEWGAGQNAAIKKGGVAIETALTTPTYYFGLGVSNIQENIAVGAGTPWLGISTDKTLRTYNGTSATNNTITANSDFILQGMILPVFGASGSFVLSLGNGASATNIIKITAPNGNVNANIVGSVSLNNDNSQYGSGVNKTVTFQVTSGATLLANTATAMGVVGGDATAPASIVVQNGGTLTIGNTAAINGNVTILPGGMFTQNQVTLTGTGTFTHSNGSILNLITSTTAMSGATQSLGTVSGTIVRMGITGLLPGTSSSGATQFDSRLNDAAIYELTTSVTMGNAAAATDSLVTLNASSGIGGVLTNDATSRTLGAATGLIAIGSGGGTFAGTTGTTLTVTENFALSANTLTISSTQSYDGNPKLGTVALNSTANTNTGSAGSVISVASGATLKLGAANQIPDATSLTVNNGATADIQTFSDTVGGVSLTGGTISGTTGVLTSTTAFDLRAGSVSAILNGSVAVNKTTAGTLTLTGANSYTGATTVTDGTLALNGSGSFASSPTITVGSGAILDVSAVTSGANFSGSSFALASGQTLRGEGSVTGSVRVLSGATLSPGSAVTSAAPGTLTVNGTTPVITLATGSKFAFYQNTTLTPVTAVSLSGGSGTAGTINNLLNVNGTFAIADPTNLTILINGDASEFADYQSYSFRIVTATNSISAFSITNQSQFDTSGFANYSSGQFQFSLLSSGNNVYLEMTTTPEPGAILAICTAALGLGFWIRRRHAKPTPSVGV